MQLTILGYILVPIFTYNLWWLVIGYSLVMALVGAYESVSRPAYTFKASIRATSAGPWLARESNGRHYAASAPWQEANKCKLQPLRPQQGPMFMALLCYICHLRQQEWSEGLRSTQNARLHGVKGFTEHQPGLLRVSAAQGMFAEVLGSILASSSVFLTYAMLLVVRTHPWWDAQYFIPMLGMLLGNCISGISVGLTTLLEELTSGAACHVPEVRVNRCDRV